MNSPGGTDQERILRENGLAFFGAITASVTHDLNNVMSIVGQSAGLLDDLLAGAEQGRPIKDEQLRRIADRIGNQTKRGVDIIRLLNSFAHSVDEPRCEFDVNQIVENLAALIERLASLKRARLETRPSGEPVRIIGWPFLLQQALFLSFRTLVAQAQKDDVLVISVARLEDGVRVSVEGPHRDEPEGDRQYLELLMDRCRGSVEISLVEDRRVFEFLVPSGA